MDRVWLLGSGYAQLDLPWLGWLQGYAGIICPQQQTAINGPASDVCRSLEGVRCGMVCAWYGTSMVVQRVDADGVCDDTTYVLASSVGRSEAC